MGLEIGLELVGVFLILIILLNKLLNKLFLLCFIKENYPITGWPRSL
jgi:hypothetical protein